MSEADIAARHEAEALAIADDMRGCMDPAEFMHVVLGLLFLKHVSDAFAERRAAARTECGAEVPALHDENLAGNLVRVPPEARWSRVRAQVGQPGIGQAVEDAMAAIERDNPFLQRALPKGYARPPLGNQNLGRLVKAIGRIGSGDGDPCPREALSRAYGHFLSLFARAEGGKEGEFRTPRCVARLMVEILEPRRGRVYDPCCGDSGMFVQAVEFVRSRTGSDGRISIWGQESRFATWRLAKMNLAFHGVEGRIAHGDSLQDDRHPDLEADFAFSHPPFNMSDWGGERRADDERWRFGIPPRGNANFAWVQHIIHHMAPGGTAAIVLANSSMSSPLPSEGAIRGNLVEAGLVNCVVALPGQLFYATEIPARVRFLVRDGGDGGMGDRRGLNTLSRCKRARSDGRSDAKGAYGRGYRPYRPLLSRMARRRERWRRRRRTRLLSERADRGSPRQGPCARPWPLCRRAALGCR